MQCDHDPEADAVYITLVPHDTVRRTLMLDDARFLDMGDAGDVLGIELLSVGAGVDVRGLPQEEEVAGLLRAQGIAVVAQTTSARASA